MYVSQPIGIRPATSSAAPAGIGYETLTLAKMNPEPTRLNGRDPVTLRTANRVKAILRFCVPDQAIAARCANYMYRRPALGGGDGSYGL